MKTRFFSALQITDDDDDDDDVLKAVTGP